MTDVTYERLDLHVDGVGLEIATARRGGELAPIVFLHGFGSTKEDYVDLAYHPGFRERPFLAYDAPGCGESSCEDLSKLSIPFLVDTAKAVLRERGSSASTLWAIPWGASPRSCSPTGTRIVS
jgi:pimeloyl-ACP methyl ester carboxylesterase